MASSTQDEEALHRKEETEPDHDEADLNKEGKTDDEAKHVDDAKKIVASESATSEQEVKDANQENERKGWTMMVPSSKKTTTTPRSLTQEEENAREVDAFASAILWSMRNEDVPPTSPSMLEIDDHDEDDSEQTLRFLTRWKAPNTPPIEIIHDRLIEQCSRPIQKQLTTSDVEQRKLYLPRKKFQKLLDESGRREIRVSVYGPDGEVQEMWLGDDDEETFELVIGWRTFVEQYGLKECCDFVTVWMFRHRDSQRICLAVDVTRFVFRKEVSKRISQAAFEDSD
ncbi:unnamed protein product [Brassica napus]|uniref:(rape) hypothetical protein n=1 Tax=Brassica napus TaxID=3708 RepID=A0A816TB91_BRANA|nr:unnamed protein product [Brassica napus]